MNWFSLVVRKLRWNATARMPLRIHKYNEYGQITLKSIYWIGCPNITISLNQCYYRLLVSSESKIPRCITLFFHFCLFSWANGWKQWPWLWLKFEINSKFSSREMNQLTVKAKQKSASFEPSVVFAALNISSFIFFMWFEHLFMRQNTFIQSSSEQRNGKMC